MKEIKEDIKKEGYSELHGIKVHGTLINDMRSSDPHCLKESIPETKQNPNSLSKPFLLGKKFNNYTYF